MKHYFEFIQEGFSSILYHITNEEAMLGIVGQNKLRLTSMIDDTQANVLDPHKLKSGKWYYLSTARTTSSSFIKDHVGISNVLLVLDGDKLKTKYSGAPVDYYAFDGSRTLKGTQKPYMYEFSEQEDRIYSKTQYIDNASNYISEIRLNINSQYNSFFSFESVKHIRDFGKKHNIPINYYVTSSSFLLGRNNVPLDHPKGRFEEKEIVTSEKAGYLSKDKFDLYLGIFEDLVYLKTLSGIRDKKTKEFIETIDSRSFDESHNYLKRMFSDLRRELNLKHSPETYHKFLKTMKTTTIDDFIDKIIYKWLTI